MTVDEFHAWYAQQPRGRYELVDGIVHAMAPERARHSRVKGEVFAALRSAVSSAGLDCLVYPDGMSVTIGDSYRREPDCIVECPPETGMEDIVVRNPVIIVEVISPSTGVFDTGVKFFDYTQISSLRHYVIIDPLGERLIQHSRTNAGAEWTSQIRGKGPMTLDPPGLTFDTTPFLEGFA